MDNANFNVQFLCRNARLSLQKASTSRKSHMLSEELEHLRNFEVIVTETLRDHPLYSSKRDQKEILELEFYLEDVRKRLLELEGKHPFLSRHISKAKVRTKLERAAIIDTQKKKNLVPGNLSRCSSSLSSSSRRDLRASSVDRGRASAPTSVRNSPLPNRSCSPASNRSSGNGTPGRRSKQPPGSSKFRSAADAYGTDEISVPLEKSKFSLDDDNNSYREKFANNTCFAGKYAEHTPLAKFLADTGDDDFDFASLKSKILSDPPDITDYDEDAGPSFDTKVKSVLDDNDDDLNFPSLKSPAQSNGSDGEDYSTWTSRKSRKGNEARDINRRDKSDRPDDDFENLGKGYRSRLLFDERHRKKLQGLSSRFKDLDDPNRHESKDAVSDTCSDKMADSLEEFLKEASHIAKTSQKDVEREEKEAVDALRTSFQELGSMLENFDYRKPNSSRSDKSDLEDSKSIPAHTMTENLEEALKRLGSLQETEASQDESESFMNDEIRSKEIRSNMDTPDVVIRSPDISTGASSLKHLLGADDTSSPDLSASPDRPRDGYEDRCSSDFEDLISDFKSGLNCTENTEGGAESSESGGWPHVREGSRSCNLEDLWDRLENIKIEQEEEMRIDDDPENGTFNKEQYKDKHGNKENEGQKKKVKFEMWNNNSETGESMLQKNVIPGEATKREASMRCLNNMNSSVGKGDVSEEDNIQSIRSVEMQRNTQYSDDDTFESELHRKLTDLSKDALSSSFSSSSSFGASPRYNSKECARSPDSTGRVSPSWDPSFMNNFEAQSLNLKSKDTNSKFYQHQLPASNPQEVTFCNPVFDFDSTVSSKTYSGSRPMFDACDVDDERLKSTMADCSHPLLQRQVDTWMMRIQTELRSQVEEVVADSVKKFESTLKTDIGKLELQSIQELANFRKEMDLKLVACDNKDVICKKPGKAVDPGGENKLERQFSQLVDMVHAGKERVISDMRNELSHFRKENEALQKNRSEVQDAMTKLVEDVKNKLEKGESLAREENESLKQQLQVVQNEGVQTRVIFDNMKKETIEQVHELRTAIDQLKIHDNEYNERVIRLQEVVKEMEKLREEHNTELTNLRRLNDEHDPAKVALRKDTVGRDGGLIMERVECLSQLYLGGLAEVRRELKDLKQKFEEVKTNYNVPCQMREKTASPSFLSSLEIRLLELEKGHHFAQLLDKKGEDIIAAVGQQKTLASVAASEAVASAQKAEETLAELFSFINSEKANVKKQNSEVQENLVNDREAIGSLLLQMMSVSTDLCKEKESALLAASTAKKKIQEVVRDFENELTRLKVDQSSMQKQKDILKNLSEEISGSAAKAKEFLKDMFQMKNKSIELSNEIFAELCQLKEKNKELSEEVASDLNNAKLKSIELSQEIVVEMANVKKKSVELGQVLGEVTNTKKKGMQLQDAAAKEMLALQMKGEELLAEITRVKQDSTQLQEAIAAEASTWTSKAEEKISGITNASIKALQCKESAMQEAAKLTSKAEEILSEMMNMRKKSSQIQESMNEATKSAIEILQEQCEEEAHGWKMMMESEVNKAKSLNDEIEKIKSKMTNPFSTENVTIKSELSQYMSRTDTTLKELTEIVKGLHKFSDSSQKCSSDDKDQIKQDVINLTQRVETVATIMEAMFHMNVKPGEVKLQDLLSDWQKIKDNCYSSEIEKKIHNFESTQKDLLTRIADVTGKTEQLERSIAVWVPKYDAAARVLNGVESRLGALEASANVSEKSLDGKESFMSFYKDLGQGKPLDDLKSINNGLDQREKGVVMSLDARIIILESRIEHVASATYTNLRILDTKVEHINGNLETALKSATTAEKKCNLLGAELVKVFRLLAHPRKNNPEKPLPSKGIHQRFTKPEILGSKRKDSVSSNRKKKPSDETDESGEGRPGRGLKTKNILPSDAVHGAEHGCPTTGKGVYYRSNRAFSVLRCNFESLDSEDGTGSGSASQTKTDENAVVASGRSTPFPKLNKDSSGFNTVTNGNPRRNFVESDSRTTGDCERSKPVLSSNSQDTDFHIESGRIHVNVRHRTRMFK